MPRPKKNKVELNKDSLVDLMQEIYNDCNNQVRRALNDLAERKNRNGEIEHVNDEYSLGKVNNESLKIINDAIEKKLTLAKLQSQILTGSANESKNDKQGSLSDDDKKLLRDMFKKSQEDNNVEYKIDDTE